MRAKQKYLCENIKDPGYNLGVFSNYLLSLKENGDDINNWELEELINAVQIFKESQKMTTASLIQKSKFIPGN